MDAVEKAKEKEKSIKRTFATAFAGTVQGIIDAALGVDMLTRADMVNILRELANRLERGE